MFNRALLRFFMRKTFDLRWQHIEEMSASLASGLALPDSTLVDLVIPRKSLVLDFIAYLICRSLSLRDL